MRDETSAGKSPQTPKAQEDIALKGENQSLEAFLPALPLIACEHLLLASAVRKGSHRDDHQSFATGSYHGPLIFNRANFLPPFIRPQRRRRL